VRGVEYGSVSYLHYICAFFFSSRRRHTSSKRDWSSDVCSSDLDLSALHAGEQRPLVCHCCPRSDGPISQLIDANGIRCRVRKNRSEERRVGKECGWREWACREETERGGDVERQRRRGARRVGEG